MTEHIKHLKIGHILQKHFSKENLVLDYACTNDTPKQQIPLFSVIEKSASSRLCNIDAALLKDGFLRVIIEIEETGIIPTKICGKFLTSAFAEYLIHNSICGSPVKINDCLFVQILNDQNLESNTKKRKQGEMIAKKINELPNKGHIKEYELFWYSDVIANSDTLISKLRKFI